MQCVACVVQFNSSYSSSFDRRFYISYFGFYCFLFFITFDVMFYVVLFQDIFGVNRRDKEK